MKTLQKHLRELYQNNWNVYTMPPLTAFYLCLLISVKIFNNVEIYQLGANVVCKKTHTQKTSYLLNIDARLGTCLKETNPMVLRELL